MFVDLRQEAGAPPDASLLLDECLFGSTETSTELTTPATANMLFDDVVVFAGYRIICSGTQQLRELLEKEDHVEVGLRYQGRSWAPRIPLTRVRCKWCTATLQLCSCSVQQHPHIEAPQSQQHAP